jgi:hypothetical protein
MTYNKMYSLFKYATPVMRSNLCKTMKVVKRMRFEPISKIFSFDPEDSDEDDSREENDDDTLIEFL